MTQETIDQVLKFRDERDWKQFHNPKDLAVPQPERSGDIHLSGSCRASGSLSVIPGQI